MNVSSVRIVLVGTTHPGNIGGVARAMKNMGFGEMVLVEPKIFPSEEAHARAAGADDILERARVCGSLRDAIADCQWVVGTSARMRKVAIPFLTPRESAAAAVDEASRSSKIAFVFGREHSGLTNEEMDLCHALVSIPADPDFSSLNIASAVQIICYELRLALTEVTASRSLDEEFPLASIEEMAEFFTRTESVLSEIGYLKPPNCEQLVRRIKRIYTRARLDRRELNILHGILSATLGNKYRWMEKNGFSKSPESDDQH